MADSTVRLFLTGDVMTGRGVDQILSHPSSPILHEPCVKDAREYVRLAEQNSGPIPRRVDSRYIWGDAIAECDRVGPAARIVNLETAITRSNHYCGQKGIHYRMHPSNIACLTAARLDVCVLANNHVLDCGREGLVETLHALDRAGIKTAGAGCTLADARRAVTLKIPTGGRLFITACAPANLVARTAAPAVRKPRRDAPCALSLCVDAMVVAH